MSFIQSVTLIKQDSATRMSPLERTKLKLVARVREQIHLAENAAYAPMHKKRVKRDDGTTAVIEVPKRMKRWWYNKADGSVELTVRVGAKKLELAKGKDAIALKSVEEVVPTLTAVRMLPARASSDCSRETGSIGSDTRLAIPQEQMCLTTSRCSATRECVGDWPSETGSIQFIQKRPRRLGRTPQEMPTNSVIKHNVDKGHCEHAPLADKKFENKRVPANVPAY